MDGLYMFAIMPPKELEERIHKQRVNFSENYNCIKALKPPVHITIYEPFTAGDDFEQKVAQLQKWADVQMPFEVKLDNYAFFENPKSPIFIIKVIKDEPIKQLHTALLKELKKFVREPEEACLPNGKPLPQPKPKPFNPHFTIGYRDVDPTLVPVIKQDYARRKFEATFLCNAIYLWKHNGKSWEVKIEYPLNNKQAQLGLF